MVPKHVVATLHAFLFALAGSLCVFAAVVVYFHVKSAGVVPAPEQVRTDNALTMVAMAAGAALIVASEAVWRASLRASPGPLSHQILNAFVARAAMRECAALLGLVVAFLCARNGVLRLYPAYWANVAPFGLFLVFAKMHWPTAENLAAEAADVLPK
jgi:hypothetical protein